MDIGAKLEYLMEARNMVSSVLLSASFPPLFSYGR